MEPLDLVRSLAVAATALATLIAARAALALHWLGREAPDPAELRTFDR